MSQLPPYFLPQPCAEGNVETLALFDALYENIQAGEPGMALDYSLIAPKWQFLSYLCGRKNIVLHGSGNPDITEFEPRKANDLTEFGDRCAVYAASDSLWAMYFAVVNKGESVTSLINACFRLLNDDGSLSLPYYFFSINEEARLNGPFRQGTLYLLPAERFERQPRQIFNGLEIEIAQWASPVPVKPMAKLTVTPEDFPLLSQIRFHAPSVWEKAVADPDGFPWVEG